jgi:pyrroloquinoline-quinone synthase
MTGELWDRTTFLRELEAVGGRSYHDKHPFHVLMNEGRLPPEAIRKWVINRFYYQTSIPRKDAAILSNCPSHEIRRLWTYRIIEHDGREGEEGGIEAWLRLGAACGIPREEMTGGGHVIPAARFAVDAYIQFCREKPWIIAMASSLTELFAPDLMARRLEAFQQHYGWVKPWGFDYFKRRLTQARTDSEGALALTLQHCDTPALQRAAVDALVFKCELLWAVLDAIHFHVPPPSPTEPSHG